MAEPIDFNIDETTVSVDVVAQQPAIINYDVAVPYVTLVTQADWTEEDPNAKGYIWHKPVLSSVATSGSYNDLSDSPTIPSATSDLLNDSGFITKEVSDLLNYTLTNDLAAVAISGDYNDLTNTPTANDFIPQPAGTSSTKFKGSTLTYQGRTFPSLWHTSQYMYPIGMAIGDQYRHLLFTEYNVRLYASTLDLKANAEITIEGNNGKTISLDNKSSYLRLYGTSLQLMQNSSSTPVLNFNVLGDSTMNLPANLTVLTNSSGAGISFVSNGKIQIVNTNTGGIEIVKSAQSIKLQDSGKLSITNGSGQTEIVGTGGISINGASNPISLAAGGGIALSGPNCTFNTVQVATVNDIPSLTGYATESYVNSAISTHNSSNNAHTDIRTSIGVIEELIPTQASTNNQLADKNFVNSSIATSTATFRGTYNVVTDLNLHYNSTHSDISLAILNTVIQADENDYVFVQIPTSDSTPTEIASIERYKFDDVIWLYEYTLNNSGFTAAQWAAINSGITSGLVTQIGTNANDIISLQTSVNGKVSKSGDTMTGALLFDTSSETKWIGAKRASGSNLTRDCIYWGSNGGSTYFGQMNSNYTGIEVTFARINSDNGFVLYGTRGVFENNSTSEENRLQRYDKIFTTGIVSDTKTWTEQADGSYSYVVSDPVTGAIPNSFITQWNTLAGLYARQSLPKAFNPTTGYFEANGLTDITYQEAIVIIAESTQLTMQGTNYPNSRTNFGIRINSISMARQWQQSNSEVAYWANTSWSLGATTSSTTFLYGCPHLRSIIYSRWSGIAGNLTITDCPSLTTIEIFASYGPAGNLNLTGAPNLSLQSIVGMVNSAQNTAAKTYTVAGNTWTACQNDTTQYTYRGQTYTGIIAYAAAKNITITN